MIYLDNAATSRYKPFSAIITMAREMARSANAGRGGHREVLKKAMLLLDARETVLRFFTGNGNVVFTKNCTEALNLAIFGDKPRGTVVTTVREHNSVLRPLYELKRRGQIDLRFLTPTVEGISRADAERAFSKDATMLVIGERSNVTGTSQSLTEITRIAWERGITVIVDGAQSVGHVKGDYTCVDMLAGSGHKGLHGAQGTGFLCVRPNVELAPLLYGGTGTASSKVVQPTELPEALESGTLNVCGILATAKGAEWTEKHFDDINGKIKKLAVAATEGLREIKGVKLYEPNDSGVILFNVAELSSTKVADILNLKFDIAVRGGLHCAPLMHSYLGTAEQGGVRISIDVNNGASDIDALLRAVFKIAKEAT